MTSSRFRRIATVVVTILFALSVGAAALSNNSAPRPAVIDAADIGGAAFEGADVLRQERNGNVTLDVTSLKSSDGRFASGLYRSGKVTIDISEPYGVDEFMYFLDGGVTLTSQDGSVQQVSAGEAVTIPKEWTGTWETDGYEKIWVIYSADGSGL